MTAEAERLAERARAVAAMLGPAVRGKGVLPDDGMAGLYRDLAAALEARDRRIAELEAGLRRMLVLIAGPHQPGPVGNDLLARIDRIARDLLERRAAGGEGCPTCKGTGIEHQWHEYRLARERLENP